MASVSQPHQGRFAPLRGARKERASLTRQPVRHPLELQGRDEEQGFPGPNKEQGLEREGKRIPSRSPALSAIGQLAVLILNSNNVLDGSAGLGYNVAQ